jgi:hypothetical protein
LVALSCFHDDHLAGRAHSEQERVGGEPAVRGLQLGHIELRIKHLFHVFLPIWTMPEVGIAQITLSISAQSAPT